MEYNPQIRDLPRPGIEAILTRNNVGRIGYTHGDRVEIRPIHYVYSDGWIYGRTSIGGKLEALGDTGRFGKEVVFEVDEVEGTFCWRSVLVRGGFYIIERNGAGYEYETWMKALGLLRALVPETMRTSDPVPERTVLFRIAVEEATGREATSPEG